MDELIKRPDAPAHAMRLKPVPRLVRVERGGVVLAESKNAIRLTELGRDVYDPAFYIPMEDLTVELTPVADKSTHCPLKGDAAYFEDASGTTIAWAYSQPLEWATDLKGLVAFFPDEVSVVEIGAQSGT